MQKASNNILMSIIFKIINYCTVCHKIKEYNSVLKSSLEPKVYVTVTSFLGYSTAEICTLVEPYSTLLNTLLFYFMNSVQPSFHKISISTSKKSNGRISWGGWL